MNNNFQRDQVCMYMFLCPWCNETKYWCVRVAILSNLKDN